MCKAGSQERLQNGGANHPYVSSPCLTSPTPWHDPNLGATPKIRKENIQGHETARPIQPKSVHKPPSSSRHSHLGARPAPHPITRTPQASHNELAQATVPHVRERGTHSAHRLAWWGRGWVTGCSRNDGRRSRVARPAQFLGRIFCNISRFLGAAVQDRRRRTTRYGRNERSLQDVTSFFRDWGGCHAHARVWECLGVRSCEHGGSR